MASTTEELPKTLESPLDSKEINQSILKEINPEYSLKELMLTFSNPYDFGQLKLGLSKPLLKPFHENACILSLKLPQCAVWGDTALGKIPDVFLTCCK